MGAFTKIAWTDHTFNGWIGCEKISPACRDCYAAVDTYARVSASRGLPLWGPGSSRHVTSDANWRKPLSWNRAAAKAGERRRVFAHSLSDVFEDRAELVAPRQRLWRLIQDTDWLDWLILTKRPENIHRMRGSLGGARGYPMNVKLGTTVERQEFVWRIEELLKNEAGGHFVSCEPLLAPLDLRKYLKPTLVANDGRRLQHPDDSAIIPGTGGTWEWGLDQVIVGGESAAKATARPFDPAWALDLLKQCRDAKTVAFLMKQMGSNPVGLSLRHLKGEDPLEWSPELQVQEIPWKRKVSHR